MIYLAQWLPGLAPLLIAIGLGLSVSRLRSIGSLFIAIGLGLYVVVVGGAAIIASQSFYTAMVSDGGGISYIINPHNFETIPCQNIGLSINGFGNVLEAYNRLAVYVAQAETIVLILYALLFVVVYAIRSALS